MKYKEMSSRLLWQRLNNVLQPYDKLPSEKSLQEQYGLSRSAVRKSLEELAQLQVINAMQGKGHFVSPAPRSLALSEIVSFEQWFMKQNDARILIEKFQLEEASLRMQSYLSLSDAFVIRRFTQQYMVLSQLVAIAHVYTTMHVKKEDVHMLRSFVKERCIVQVDAISVLMQKEQVPCLRFLLSERNGQGEAIVFRELIILNGFVTIQGM